MYLCLCVCAVSARVRAYYVSARALCACVRNFTVAAFSNFS